MKKTGSADGHGQPDAGMSHDPAPVPADAATATDPVCGMTVTLTPTARTGIFGGAAFHFCSGKCQTIFRADPWFYASGNAAKITSAAPTGTQYTCPMHPDFTRRMWVSATASVPLVMLTMGSYVGLPLRDRIGHELSGWIKLALATPIFIRW